MDRLTNEDQQYISRLTRSLHKEYVDSVFKQISEDELRALRLETRRTAKQIYENWEKLGSIVQRHESTIQRRWTKKSILKRRELLLGTWPNMARDHRPDFVLVSKNNNLRAELKKATGEMLRGRSWQPKKHEGSQREALLMPYINLHDLTKTEPLLLMINGRARHVRIEG